MRHFYCCIILLKKDKEVIAKEFYKTQWCKTIKCAIYGNKVCAQ